MSAGDQMIDAIADAVALRLEKFVGVRQRLMDVGDAAQYLGMTVPALRNKVSHHEVPVVKIDNKMRFDRRDLDRLIDTAEREGV